MDFAKPEKFINSAQYYGDMTQYLQLFFSYRKYNNFQAHGLLSTSVNFGKV